MQTDVIERVRQELEEARKLAWEAFYSPSEESVMAIFKRMTVVASKTAPVDASNEASAVHH